jgi:hypothetical protein
MNDKETELVTAVWRNSGCSAPYDSLVVSSSAVFQMNICAENPPLRQAANRYPDRNSQRAIFVPEHTFVIPGIAHTHALHLAKNH